MSLADVVLDPIHFGGGHTSYESFALGVPVVTWPGQFLRSRITLAHCLKMGVTDTVVHDANNYAKLAVTLGTDRAARSQLSDRIQNQNAILFEDLAEIRAIEDCLRSLV